ncbi:amidohydrolase [Carboxydothermus hydrogenoformans]|uniref:Amidohydrolase family protein n=1 Tax=Carboxydothermus hydrogenoformans (strain ATCC BAA-161 / DSM 6008 / Z-2901) TaxID=246194 RepID=Q3AE62_CARHZ|nr:amidohydrolase [Carboxydothermus hydrogenoformans]ABB14395.1 amidohydrolase family protein [Carboxydothermus hydrogenoformans Z-2901]
MKVLKNGVIVLASGEQLKGDLLIDDEGKIVKIGEEIFIDGGEVIDLKGQYVYPGLIDAHTHIGLMEEGIDFVGEDINEYYDPVTPQARAIDGIYPFDVAFREAYQEGVLAVGVLPGSSNPVGGTGYALSTRGKTVDRMAFGPCGLKIAFGENPKKNYAGQKRLPATRMGTAMLIRENLLYAREYLRKKEKGEKVEFDLKKEAFIPVLKREIPLRAHAHRADDIMTAIRIAREVEVDVVIEHCTEGHLIIEELKEARVPVVVGPTLTGRSKYELRELGWETPVNLIKAGVKTAIMTDHPVIPLKYLRLLGFLLQNYGLTEKEILPLFTKNPAEILQINSFVGDIKPNLWANLIVTEKPLFALGKISMVFFKGEKIVG